MRPQFRAFPPASVTVVDVFIIYMPILTTVLVELPADSIPRIHLTAERIINNRGMYGV
jgi:hypothetical protein